MSKIFPGEYDHSQDDLDIQGLALVDETDRAFLLTDGAVSAWVPKGLVKELEDSALTLSAYRMPEWLAKKSRFI